MKKFIPIFLLLFIGATIWTKRVHIIVFHTVNPGLITSLDNKWHNNPDSHDKGSKEKNTFSGAPLCYEKGTTNIVACVVSDVWSDAWNSTLRPFLNGQGTNKVVIVDGGTVYDALDANNLEFKYD